MSDSVHVNVSACVHRSGTCPPDFKCHCAHGNKSGSCSSSCTSGSPSCHPHPQQHDEPSYHHLWHQNSRHCGQHDMGNHAVNDSKPAKPQQKCGPPAYGPPCGPDNKASPGCHAPMCHDVSVLLNQMNALTLPLIQYASSPHPPLAICPCPADAHAQLPHVFAFDNRLVRDELHHPLLCYLAEGVSPVAFTCGAPATKVRSAHALLAVDRPDGYRALQYLIYGHLLLSLNLVLLEDSARNSCLDHRRLWSVSSPCGATAAHDSCLELRVGGTTSVALEVHPTTVVPNELMDAVICVVQSGAAWDKNRGRIVAVTMGDPLLHSDALTLLTQVWTRFAREGARKDSSVSWIVLSNVEKSIVFRRAAREIKVSHVIGSGHSTPRDACQNLYTLLLALSTLEKHQYHSPSAVELVLL